MVGAVNRHILHHRTKFRKDLSNHCRDISIFVISKMAVAATLDFQKFEILTIGPLVSFQYSSSKSVMRLQRYGDLTVFKMAAVRHLGFVKFEIFKVGAVKRPILHHRTRFRKDVAIFVIFKMAATGS